MEPVLQQGHYPLKVTKKAKSGRMLTIYTTKTKLTCSSKDKHMIYYLVWSVRSINTNIRLKTHHIGIFCEIYAQWSPSSQNSEQQRCRSREGWVLSNFRFHSKSSVSFEITNGVPPKLTWSKLQPKFHFERRKVTISRRVF